MFMLDIKIFESLIPFTLFQFLKSFTIISDFYMNEQWIQPVLKLSNNSSLKSRLGHAWKQMMMFIMDKFKMVICYT